MEYDNVIGRDEKGCLYGNGVDGDRAVRSSLQAILKDTNISTNSMGQLGTHSIRKGAATFCSNCSLPKDIIESRGRWRGNTRQVDTYIDTQRPYPDAQVSACLCGPSGPIVYKIATNITWLTREFIITKVAKKINLVMGNEMAFLLGVPLLWAALQGASLSDPNLQLMPITLQNRIRNAINHELNNSIQNDITNSDIAIANPVERVPIVITGSGGRLELAEINVLPSERVDSAIDSINKNIHTDTQEIHRQLSAMNATIFSIKRRTEELLSYIQNEINYLRKEQHSIGDTLYRSVSRIAVQPVDRTVQSDNISQPSELKLSKSPKTLYNLWHEYEYGYGGHKPAKLFTARERGCKSIKHTYSLRLGFWKLVAELIRKGRTSGCAVDEIYRVYGRNQTVTAILREIRKDKLRGGHPELT